MQVNKWKKQIEKDVEAWKLETNQALIKKVMEKNSVEAEGIPDVKLLREQVLPMDSVERIVGYAVSHHVMNSDATFKNDKLLITPACLAHSVEMLANSQPESSGVCSSASDAGTISLLSRYSSRR